MRKLFIKEVRMAASPLSFLFIAFGLMFFLPGYPILCGAFFVTLGLFQSFQNMKETNDILFSALLPISKNEVVKGKYLFCLFVELCGFLLMAVSTVLRMTVFAGSGVYLNNALMTANPFALACALLIFALFNLLFIGGFFKTAYKISAPFLKYVLSSFLLLIAAEALHHFPGLEFLNSFRIDSFQIAILPVGLLLFALITQHSFQKACTNFEHTDL